MSTNADEEDSTAWTDEQWDAYKEKCRQQELPWHAWIETHFPGTVTPQEYNESHARAYINEHRSERGLRLAGGEDVRQAFTHECQIVDDVTELDYSFVTVTPYGRSLRKRETA